MQRFSQLLAILKKNAKLVFLGTAVFLVGLVWNFPFDKIKEAIQAAVYNQTRVVLEVSTLRPALPLGFEFIGPRVSNLRLGAKTMAFDLDSLSLTVSPWSALTFALAKSGTVSFDAAKQTFRASGGLSTGKKTSGLAIRLRNLKVDETFALPSNDPFSGSGMEVGFVGTAEGRIEAELDTSGMQKQDYSGLEGDGKITLTSVTVRTPLLGPLEFQKVILDVKASKGTLDIRSITLAGNKLSGKGSGSIKINPYFPQSSIKLDATLNFSDEAGQLKSLIQTMGSAAGFTMDGSGNVPIKLTGTVGQPSLRGY